MGNEESVERPGQLAAGRLVGHYRVEAWIGEGAMGVVYRALDTRLNRPVALKVLRPESIANPERRKRFVHEARAASSLNHPNIITIYEIDSADGVDFIAMEYVEGTTLGHLIGRKGMSWNEAVRYGVQIADALATAQAAGLIHRDLKPGNIMVSNQGLVKVLDFGLAKLIEPAEPPPGAKDEWSDTRSAGLDDTPRTEEGTVVGTVAYMSPEQAEGKPVDGRSDVFSFGSMLYEMLTGQWPFRGDSKLAILAAILREEAKPARELAEDVPVELERVLLRCLRKDPSRRFQHMADLKVALQELKEESDSSRLLAARLLGLRRRTHVTAIVVTALLVLVGWLVWARPAWLHERRLPPQKLLAVLPFLNVGGDPANQPFCDGLAETLTSRLTQLEQFQSALRVVPASEVRRERISSARDAREAFGASLVVTGSVHRTGGQVLLTANLVDASTVVQLRSRNIQTPVENLSSLQDGAVKAIIEMLELELGPQARLAISAGGTAVPSAYDFYVQGRGYLQYYDRLENVDNAITLFQQALEKDPSYALAYAGLGEAYWQRHRLTNEAQWVTEARKSCQRAARLNDRLAPVHVTLGVLYRGTGEYEKAVQELQTALQLDPLSADAYRELAGAYEVMGRLEEAEATFRKAIRLRPGYWGGYNDLGGFYYRRGRYADAAGQYRAVVGLIPDSARGYSSLGSMYHLLGQNEEAERFLQKSISIKPTASAYSNLGTVYTFQGRYPDAVPVMEKAIELGTNSYLIWGNLAEAYQRAPALADKSAAAYHKAIELATQELAINPKAAPVRASMAFYWAKLGRKKQALSEIEEARKLAPKNVNILFRTALVYELTGDRDRALDVLTAAVQSGYSMEQVRRARDLEELRKDLRYQKLVEGRPSQ